GSDGACDVPPLRTWLHDAIAIVAQRYRGLAGFRVGGERAGKQPAQQRLDVGRALRERRADQAAIVGRPDARTRGRGFAWRPTLALGLTHARLVGPEHCAGIAP